MECHLLLVASPAWCLSPVVNDGVPQRSPLGLLGWPATLRLLRDVTKRFPISTTFRVRIAPHLQTFRSLFPAISRHQSFSARLLPHELARQECTAHRKELEMIRDMRARQLGELSFLGTSHHCLRGRGRTFVFEILGF